MKPELSKHVQQEMGRRGIPLAVVESVLAAPGQKVPEHGDVVCYQSKVEMNQKAVSGAGDGERNGNTAESGDGLPDEQNQPILEPDMKVTYDPGVDVLRILFRDAPIEESDEDKPGVILDYDSDGNIVGLEVLNASQRVANPRGVEYAVTG
jgi:uncharacterized protein YuzE